MKPTNRWPVPSIPGSSTSLSVDAVVPLQLTGKMPLTLSFMLATDYQPVGAAVASASWATLPYAESSQTGGIFGGLGLQPPV